MYKIKNKKDDSDMTMIGKTDGPSAIGIIGKNTKLTLRQKLEKYRYKIKRAYVEKTLKANSHSLDEVMDYIVNVHGFVEMEGEGVRQEYEEMRASSILQYAPELLGEYATMPQLKGESEEDIREYISQSVERQKKAILPKLLSMICVPIWRDLERLVLFATVILMNLRKDITIPLNVQENVGASSLVKKSKSHMEIALISA